MRRLFLLSAFFFLVSCNGGLEPTIPTEPGFSGVVSFVPGTWPSPDSLVSLWVFASQIYPLDSTTVFSGILASPPRIYLYPALTQSLPFNVDSVHYDLTAAVGTYKYIGVLQQFNPLLTIRSFQVVAFLADANNAALPRSLLVKEGERVTNINLRVDFHSLPPQPF